MQRSIVLTLFYDIINRIQLHHVEFECVGRVQQMSGARKDT